MVSLKRVDRMSLLAAASCCLLLSVPAARATSCDEQQIKNRSVEETAAQILDASDYVGFGFVHEVTGDPTIRQQEIDMVVPLKGPAAKIKLSPEWVKGVGQVDNLMRWFYFPEKELRLFALVQDVDGAVTPVCLAASIALKSTPELYRALSTLAARRKQAL